MYKSNGYNNKNFDKRKKYYVFNAISLLSCVPLI